MNDSPLIFKYDLIRDQLDLRGTREDNLFGYISRDLENFIYFFADLSPIEEVKEIDSFEFDANTFVYIYDQNEGRVFPTSLTPNTIDGWHEHLGTYKNIYFFATLSADTPEVVEGRTEDEEERSNLVNEIADAVMQRFLEHEEEKLQVIKRRNEKAFQEHMRAFNTSDVRVLPDPPKVDHNLYYYQFNNPSFMERIRSRLKKKVNKVDYCVDHGLQNDTLPIRNGWDQVNGSH